MNNEDSADCNISNYQNIRHQQSNYRLPEPYKVLATHLKNT